MPVLYGQKIAELIDAHRKIDPINDYKMVQAVYTCSIYVLKNVFL